MIKRIAVWIAFVYWCCVLPVTCVICNWTYTGKNLQECYPCPPGFYKNDDCIAFHTQAYCSPCQRGTYMPYCNTKYSCLACTSPCSGQGMEMLVDCTASTNYVCQCQEGMFLKDDYCQPYSWCPRGQGIKVKGNAYNNTECEDCVPGKTYSTFISAYETCKPCTVCDAYLNKCTKTSDALCQYVKKNEDSSTVTVLIVVCAGLISAIFIGSGCICLYARLKRSKRKARDRQQVRTEALLSPKSEAIQEEDSDDCSDISAGDGKFIHIEEEQSKQNTICPKERYVPFPENKPLFIEKPENKPLLIVKPTVINRSENGNSKETNVTIDVHCQTLIPEYRNIEETALFDECANNAYGNCNIKRQVERHLSAPETRKGSDENSVLTGAENSDIDWFKIFKDLVPILPVNDYSWKFFAFELFHFTQQRCGLPKDIHNEVKIIEHGANYIYLRYHEVLNTWYRLMANEASLEQIEHSLERFEDKIIMQEFSQMKRKPPTRKRFPQNMETSIMPWRHNEQLYAPNFPPSLFAYAQHESTYETAEGHRRLSHIRDRKFVQLTNLPAATPSETTRTFPPDSSRLALEHVQRRKQKCSNENNAFHKVSSRGSKVKKKTQRKILKLKKKLKEAKLYKKAYEDEQNDNITLIKKILPHDQLQLSREEYNKFLDYTVNVIMKHNNVTRKTVLSITYKSYTEIAETKNGGRYILYSGSPNLKLDKEQYDCLVFYVKYARSRVLKEIAELEDNGDTLFLFISYDGKSAIEVYQKQSQLKKSKYLLSRYDSDSYSSSTGDSSPESESSEVNGMEIGVDLCSQASETSANNNKYCNPYDSVLYERTIHAAQKYENNTSLKKEYNISIPKHSATVILEQGNNEQRDESDVVEDNQVAALVKRLPEGDTEKENETSSVCITAEKEDEIREIMNSFCAQNEDTSNHNSGMQEKHSDVNLSLEDLMRDIDKELECTTSV